VRRLSAGVIITLRSAPSTIFSSEQGCLVDEVREVGADHPRRGGCERTEIDVLPERDTARVYLEDFLASVLIGRLHGHAAVEPSRSKQCLVEHIRPVRRPDHDDAGRRVEPVHLRQDLVQRLLALVVAAAEAGGA
jgi:hypothetical protein